MTLEEILKLLSGLSCPISLDLMVDPVIIASGITFERTQIGEWFSLGNRFVLLLKFLLYHLLYLKIQKQENV